MAAPQPGSSLERLVAPWPLLLGVAASFLACCAFGAWYGRHNVYDNFARFHEKISPESLHYPSASQVLALARARLPRDKVAVIVGGNSIMHGTGQRAELLWTKALQARLGDDYRVLNLAMRGALAGEFGGAVAEAFSREHPRVIFVTLTNYGVGGSPDGALYEYFYWDAFYKGLLLPSAEREALLRRVESVRDPDKFAELKRQARLNSYCCFNDLWNALAYSRLSTVWARPVYDHPFRPRKRFPDGDLGPAVPFASRYAPAQVPFVVQRIRTWTQFGRGLLPYKVGAGGDAPEIDLERSDTVRQLRADFPAPCRPRTLVLFPYENPYYFSQLSPAEQAADRQLVLDQVRAAEGAGFASLAVGRDFTVEDCYDGGGHYTEQGGFRLAGEVAPKVRDMARRLGYAGP
ncbi:MAG TPA: hypothetical protein VFE78_03045 [Gemmataceae bacterium]|nr:hypothetical protein [Gemmataceae bacterium]